MKHPTAAAIFAAGTITGGLLLAPTPADAKHQGIPHRAILMFQGRCPRGYTGVYDLNRGRFPRGSFEGNRSGGTTDHTHTTREIGARTGGADFDWVGGTQYEINSHYGDDETAQAHTHGLIVPSQTTTSAEHLPPYAEVTFCTPS